jgi:hypothetical protein
VIKIITKKKKNLVNKNMNIFIFIVIIYFIMNYSTIFIIIIIDNAIESISVIFLQRYNQVIHVIKLYKSLEIPKDNFTFS